MLSRVIHSLGSIAYYGGELLGSWIEAKVAGRTKAYNAAHPPPGERRGTFWVAYHRQDIDE